VSTPPPGRRWYASWTRSGRHSFVPARSNLGLGPDAGAELTAHERRDAVGVVAAADSDRLASVVDETERHRLLRVAAERGGEHEAHEDGEGGKDADPDGDLDAAGEREPRVLLGRLQVRVRVAPPLTALARAAARLLPEVLLGRVEEVLPGDARAFICVVDERGHAEDVLQAVGVALLRVSAARAVEARDRSPAVAAVERRAGLAEIAVGTGGHAGDETYPFRHGFDTHARDGHG
jgi:hypothetical protein